MNLEDLILDTQISELRRLQSRCTEARSGIEKIQSKLKELNDQSAKTIDELQTRHNSELNNAVSQLDAEAQKHRDHAVASSDSLKDAARQARTRQLSELHTRLQKDIAECRRKLQSDLDSLQASNDEPAVQVSNDFAELPAVASQVNAPVAFMKPQVEVEPLLQVAAKPAKKRRKGIARNHVQEPAKLAAVSPKSSVIPLDVSDESEGERVNFDEPDTSAKPATRKASGWSGGWRLLVLCLLIFAGVTIGAALSRIDLGSAMNFEFSEADLTWVGISALVGAGAALLVGLMLRLIPSRKQRAAVVTDPQVPDAVSVRKVAEAKTVDSIAVESEAMTAPAVTAFGVEEELIGIEIEGFDQDGNNRVGDPKKGELGGPADISYLMASSPVPIRPEHRVASAESILRQWAQNVTKLQAACDQQVSDLIRRYTDLISQHVETIEDQVVSGSTATAEALQSIDAWRSQEFSRIQDHYKVEFERVRGHFLQDSSAEPQRLSDEAKSLHSRWKSNLTIASELARIIRDRATVYPEWSELLSKPWSAPTTVPVALTLGEILATFPIPPEKFDGDLSEELTIELPGVVNFPQNSSFAIQHDGSSRESALDFVSALLLRILTSLAPRAARFSLIDPVNSHSRFSGLTRLAEFGDQLIDVSASGESTEIADQLQNISDRIESVQLTCLQSDSKSIEEHNGKVGTTAIPYQFVVVTGFSENFSEASASLLTSILSEGPRCGVFTIVVWSANQKVPRSFELNTVQNCCVLLHLDNGSVQSGLLPAQRSAETANPFVKFTALTPPNPKDYARIVSAVGEVARGEGSVSASEALATSKKMAAQPEGVTATSIVADSEAVEKIEVQTQPGEVVDIAPADQSSEADQTSVSREEASFDVDKSSSVDAVDPVQNDALSDGLVNTDVDAVAARLEDCEPLRELLAKPSAAASTSGSGLAVWLGEADANSSPFGINFSRTRGQNLLIVGEDSRLADAILASTILSSCAGATVEGKPRSSLMIVLHDEQGQESLKAFSEAFTKDAVPGLSLRGAADAEKIIGALLHEMTSREARKGAGESPEIVFAVRNISQFAALRRDEESEGTIGFGPPKAAPPILKFSDLIRKGPQVGIHVILWADTFASAMRSLSHSLLREFDSRIALSVNHDDSNSLIGSADAASLGSGRAIFYMDQSGATERFRPFSWPTTAWLAGITSATVDQVDKQTSPNEAEGNHVAAVDLVEAHVNHSLGDQAPVDQADAAAVAEELFAEVATNDDSQLEQPLTPIAAFADSPVSSPAVADQVAEIAVHEAPALALESTEDAIPEFQLADSPVVDVPEIAWPDAEVSTFETTVADLSLGQTTAMPMLEEQQIANLLVTSSEDSSEASFELAPEIQPTAAPLPVAAELPPTNSEGPDSVPSTKIDSPAPSAKAPAPKPNRPSATVVRLASRNTDPKRALDAPPDRQTQENAVTATNQPAPDAEFDEMDFNSIMIE